MKILLSIEMKNAFVVLGFIFISLISPYVFGAETDQYLTWDVELKDSAEILNEYFNTTLENYLEHVNRRSKPIRNPEELTIAVYYHFFHFLGWSRLRTYLRNNPNVDKYPTMDVGKFEYYQMSIHNGFAFPYFFLPMARTIRVGDVYFGIDKLCHFFGFGRRYYQRYCRYIREGLSEEEAMKKVVLWGIFHEDNLVGKLVDGIFSHGDLEANYQGFLLARDLCGGDPPYIENIDGKWKLVRKIDFRDYINPGFDESYNNNHYWLMRKRIVLRTLREKYCSRLNTPIVRERFSKYKRWEPSFNQMMIKEYFGKKGHNPQIEQSIWNLCMDEEVDTHKKDNKIRNNLSLVESVDKEG